MQETRDKKAMRHTENKQHIARRKLLLTSDYRIYLFSWPCPCISKFLGQGLNPLHSSDPSCCSDTPGPSPAVPQENPTTNYKLTNQKTETIRMG